MIIEDFKKIVSSKKMMIGIVGFGYIGTCMGAVLADKGYKILGIDTNDKIVEEINSGKTSIREPGLSELIKKNKSRITATSDFSVIENCQVVIVTVGTPLNEDFSPNNEQIIQASKTIAPYIAKDTLVILKSTVPPKTTINVVHPLLSKSKNSKSLMLTFCPERLAEGSAINEFKKIPVVVGGTDKRSTIFASEFWKLSMNLDTIQMNDSTSAELVKLADNLWIDLNIALANELAVVSDKLNLDSRQVIAAANTLPKGSNFVNILYPGIGVGGYCLTKDPWFVYHLGKSYGLELETPKASRKANDSMPSYSFRRISENFVQRKKDISKAKIAVLGISFKNNTGDCRYTPTVPIINLLSETGANITVYDPWVSKGEIESLLPNIPIAKSIALALKDADCVAFLAGHDEFLDISPLQLSEYCANDSLIFDGRGMFSSKDKEELENHGFTYISVGG